MDDFILEIYLSRVHYYMGENINIVLVMEMTGSRETSIPIGPQCTLYF